MRRWLIEKFLRRRGLTVVSADGPNFEAALQRLAKREIVIQTVIDVGASDGAWSRQVLKVFPKVRVLCIEAQQAHEPALREFMAGNSRAGYVLAAAGPRIGQISFDDTALFGGSAAEYAPEGKVTQVAMTTIDHEIAKRSLPGPYLIKLDTHGFELEILDGAKQTLEQTNALVIEVYNFDLGRGVPRFHQICSILEERGFRCIDLFDPMYRPNDGVLWQMDLVFARADRPEFANARYS